MSGVNKVILIGNAGKDPESVLAGTAQVTKVSVATSESFKDKNTGEKKDVTEWHRVTFFGRTAEIVAEYVRKGSKIYVEGSIKTNKWQDKTTGETKYSTEIIGRNVQLLDSKSDKKESYDEVPFDSFEEDISF
jgi:single-strand DNA-binding protein